jgi:formylglycine-generating enzyme required for sulfatase activity
LFIRQNHASALNYVVTDLLKGRNQMKCIQTCLTVIFFLIFAPALADETTNDPFQDVVAKYRAANPKPELPEEARKFKVQAEFAVQEKQFDKAMGLYGKALEIAPWWPAGHFNRAVMLGEAKKYRDAMSEMKRYLLLVPDAPDARAVQDKIYQWEGVAEPEIPTMVVIPGGSFHMGLDDPQDNASPWTVPVHEVTIKAFEMGKTVVTQGQWAAIMGNNPSNYKNCGDNCPVENVSWHDAQAFIRKLNAKTGKQYRLPSEAEWEYACRAGGPQVYCGSDSADSVGWFISNSGDMTHPVATKQANAFGLYDMIGNVVEWVEDSYHENYKGAPADGSVWQGDGEKRMLRGLSYTHDPRSVSKIAMAMRYGLEPNRRGSIGGFRVARTLP